MERVTNVVVIKTPRAAYVCSITHRLLALSHKEINLSSILRSAGLERLKVHAVAVALVVAIDEDDHSQPLCDIFPACQSDREYLRMVGDSDESLHDAITIAQRVFWEGCPSFGPLDHANKVLQGWHDGGGLR